MKIIAFGSVYGNYDILLKKIRGAMKRTSSQFDICLCVGDFFGQDIDFQHFYAYRSEMESLNLDFYILNDSHLEPSDTKINFMSNCGIIETLSGLNIAFFQTDSSSKINQMSNVSEVIMKHKALALSKANYKGIDVLMTIKFPNYIQNYCDNESVLKFDKIDSNHYSDEISCLTFNLMPRYHLSSSDYYIDRVPYRNHIILQEKPILPTRFISIASLVKDCSKEKNIYAFNIEPLSQLNDEQLKMEITKKISSQTVQNPFPKTQLDEMNKYNEIPRKKQYFFSSNESKSHSQQSTNCWFCLDNPKIEKHLIVYQDKEAYITLPKGPVFENHLMICCNDHFRCQLEIPTNVKANIEKLKNIIIRFCDDNEKFCLFTERNFKSKHMSIDCFCLDKGLEPRVERIFSEFSVINNIKLEEFSTDMDWKEKIQLNKPYYYCEFDTVILLCTNMAKFPINFTRQVVCSPSLLNVANKVDWKSCSLEYDTEEKSAKQMMEKLKPYIVNKCNTSHN